MSSVIFPVTYSANNPYAGNRPWADVQFKSSRSPVLTLKCLVDTGADYLQINISDAAAAGISLAAATATSVSTVAGTAILQLVSGVQVSIEGSPPLTIDILVDPSNGTKPALAGRQLLLAAFDIGFNVSEWLRT